jgi:hypothetical protein
MEQNDWSFRELYQTLELPGANPLKDAHHKLDAAVRTAYGMGPEDDALTFLLGLNEELAEREANGMLIVGPGLPSVVDNPSEFITEDCVKMG